MARKPAIIVTDEIQYSVRITRRAFYYSQADAAGMLERVITEGLAPFLDQPADKVEVSVLRWEVSRTNLAVSKPTKA